jgi:hypothetical protein
LARGLACEYISIYVNAPKPFSFRKGIGGIERFEPDFESGCMTVIVFAELTSTDLRHAPVDAMLLKTIAIAVPNAEVRFFGESRHLDRIGDLLGKIPAKVSFHPIPLSGHEPSHLSRVSIRRLRHNFVSLLRATKNGRDIILVTSSASATAILASALVMIVRWRSVRLVENILHGELNNIRHKWRSRNPIYRLLDLKTCLTFWRGSRFRYLVLEDGIKAALGKEVPGIENYVDVVLHPVNETEYSGSNLLPFAYPVALGMLGAITQSKGFPFYAGLAKKFGQTHPDRLHFHIIGRVNREFDKFDFSSFQPPVSFEDLARKSFIERVRRLHFVCLPLQGDYYSLAASGTLMDAITCCKPVIVTATPLTRALFAEFGDIGYLCDFLTDFERVLLRISGGLDVARYRRQVEAMSELYRSRTPEALALTFREYLQAAER